MAPVWLTVTAWVYLSVFFCCAGIISYDIVFNHRRQPMGVMNFVFPITALYFGPFAVALYWRWGRAAARTTMAPAPMKTVPTSRQLLHLLVTSCRRVMASTLITARPDPQRQVALPNRHRRASRARHGGSRWPSRSATAALDAP